jgi:hypothetical protein
MNTRREEVVFLAVAMAITIAWVFLPTSELFFIVFAIAVAAYAGVRAVRWTKRPWLVLGWILGAGIVLFFYVRFVFFWLTDSKR